MLRIKQEATDTNFQTLYMTQMRNRSSPSALQPNALTTRNEVDKLVCLVRSQGLTDL